MHTFYRRCTFSARVQSVGSVAVSQHCCTLSTPLQPCLHYVSPAAVWQLSCILSAQLQSICSSVFCHAINCCDRPAARYQLSYEMQAPLQSVISAAICLLSLSAMCQLISAQLLSEGSDSICQFGRQVSCNLSAELRPVSRDEPCHLSCNVLAEL